jgi:hypothetical protein
MRFQLLQLAFCFSPILCSFLVGERRFRSGIVLKNIGMKFGRSLAETMFGQLIEQRSVGSIAQRIFAKRRLLARVTIPIVEANVFEIDASQGGFIVGHGQPVIPFLAVLSALLTR